MCYTNVRKCLNYNINRKKHKFVYIVVLNYGKICVEKNRTE